MIPTTTEMSYIARAESLDTDGAGTEEHSVHFVKGSHDETETEGAQYIVSLSDAFVTCYSQNDMT